MTFVHHGFGNAGVRPKNRRLNLRKSRRLPDTAALPVLPSDCESAGGATGRKHPQAYARKKLRFHKFRINSWLKKCRQSRVLLPGDFGFLILIQVFDEPLIEQICNKDSGRYQDH
jgi:hypothetical protein